MKKFFSFFVFCGALMLAACGSGSDDNGGGGKTTKLTALDIVPHNIAFAPGISQQMTVKKTPETSTTKLTWSSSDETVATVSNTGVVNTLKHGTTDITASGNGLTATCHVEVGEIVVALQYETTNSGTFTVGDVKTLYLNDPSDSRDWAVQAKWSIDDSSVATLSQTEGTSTTFTCKGSGTANITAKIGPITRSYLLTVKAKTDVDIYVLGTNSDGYATVRKNNMLLYNLCKSDEAKLYGLSVVGSDVYTCLQETNTGISYVYKNNNAIATYGSDKLYNSLLATSNALYVVCKIINTGETILLKNGATVASLGIDAPIKSDLVLSGSYLYVAGYIIQSGQKVPYLWKIDITKTSNNVTAVPLNANLLPGNHSAMALTVSGQNVYICGQDLALVETTSKGYVWKYDGTNVSTLNTFTLGYGGFLYAIALSGSDILVGGTGNHYMWKNGTEISLVSDSAINRIYDIKSSNNKVYAIGTIGTGCAMWIDGVKSELSLKVARKIIVIPNS